MNLEANFRLQRGRLPLDIEVAVDDGQTLALVGPNGAGKTTCLRALAGLTPIDEGYVRMHDHAVDEGAGGAFVPPETRSVGYVFQEHLLFPHLTALDNVAFGLITRGVHRKLARSAASTWLNRVDMAAHAHALPRELSGGQAQRVALARALAIKPRLLLLDEPLAAADASARLALRHTIRAQLELFAGACVLVAHEIGDALALADRIAVIEEGRVVQSGTIDDLVHKPSSRFVADLVGLNCFRGECADDVLTLPSGGKLILGTHYSGPAIVTLHPRAVALFRERPAGSPRNVFRAPIAATERALDCVRVQLGGDIPVVAEVTDSAVRDLALDRGGDVWVAIKATEFRLAPA